MYLCKQKRLESQRYSVVFCTPALYSAGGVERVVAVKANYFTEQLGYDVTIIVTEGRERECFFPLSNQVKVVNLELGFEELWRLPFWRKMIAYIQKQKRYKRLLTKELMLIHPDYTISTLRREINFLSSIHDGSIKIGELHVNRANYRNFDERKSNFIKRSFARFWMTSLVRHLKKLDKMVVLTDSALHDWQELTNVVKIPDPLPFQIKERGELSAKRVISIGRYDYDKGNDLLLKVWSKVEKQLPDWSLDIYGNGDCESFQGLMTQLEKCHLHGPVKDVKQTYLHSSVFVLPSRYEGFGLVLIEAMACGVPVIAFDCENGPRSIVSDGVDGFLIPPFDIEVFAEKLILLMRDEDLRRQMGGHAQKSAEKYDVNKIGLQWKHLFDELMAKR